MAPTNTHFTQSLSGKADSAKADSAEADSAKLKSLEQAMLRAVANLEQGFESICQQRMQGLPIINPSLSVRALGFQPWQEYWFGGLLTPWFINLMLLPRDEDIEGIQVGQLYTFAFPSGDFAFIGAFEESIGYYLSCSLLSPVNGLDSQRQAEALVMDALQAIFEEDAKADAADPKSAQSTDANAVLPKPKSVMPETAAEDKASGKSTRLSRRRFFTRFTSRTVDTNHLGNSNKQADNSGSVSGGGNQQ